MYYINGSSNTSTIWWLYVALAGLFCKTWNSMGSIMSYATHFSRGSTCEKVNLCFISKMMTFMVFNKASSLFVSVFFVKLTHFQNDLRIHMMLCSWFGSQLVLNLLMFLSNYNTFLCVLIDQITPLISIWLRFDPGLVNQIVHIL